MHTRDLVEIADLEAKISGLLMKVAREPAVTPLHCIGQT
jgi:hypothetical protein